MDKDLQTKPNRVCASGMRAERQDGIQTHFLHTTPSSVPELCQRV